MDPEVSDCNKTDEDAPLPKCCWRFHPSYKRFLVLIYIVMIIFWSSTTYDIAGALEIQIERTFSIKPYEFEYMYSVYTFPNIVLCVFGGFLIDRQFGVVIASLIFCGFYIIGQTVTTIGALINMYWLMLVGRFIYGLGGESLGVVAMYYLVIWFTGREMNLVCGCLQTFGRLGTSFIFLVATPLYNYAKSQNRSGMELGAAMSFGIAASVFMFILLIVVAWESRRNNKISNGPIQEKTSKVQETDIKFKNVINFNIKFWLVNILIISFVTAVYVFISCSQNLLMSKFKYSTEKASQISSMFNIISALGSPLIGFIVDKTGREMFFITTGLTMGVISQIILAFTSWNPFVSMVIFAFSYSLLSSCSWALVPLVVHPYQVGTAYGIVEGSVSLSLTVSTIFAGYLLGTYGSSAVTLFYLALLLMGLACTILLWILDRKENGVLNLPASLKKNL